MNLSDYSIDILRYIKANGTVVAHETPYDLTAFPDLESLGVIKRVLLCPAGTEGHYVDFYGYVITIAGESELERYDLEIKQQKRQKFHEWVNTLIALSALVIAILQLLFG